MRETGVRGDLVDHREVRLLDGRDVVGGDRRGRGRDGDEGGAETKGDDGKDERAAQAGTS